jgi:hypothetical protein
VYCYDADVFDVVERLEPSARGELEITDVNNHYVREGTSRARRRSRVTGATQGESVDAYYEVIERVRRPHFGCGRPAVRFRSSASRTGAGWLAEIAARARCRSRSGRRTSRSRGKGRFAACHYHERGQDDLFVCLQGRARVVALNRETGETFCEDIGDDNFAAVYIPGISRTASRR